MPPIDAKAHPDNPIARMFAAFQSNGRRNAEPLKDADGNPFLQGAFDEIQTRWGSVDRYLQLEIGLSGNDIRRLRRLYLE